MNHSNNNKSAQKVTAELIDLDDTDPINSPLKEELLEDPDYDEPQGGILSENEEIIMVSAPIDD